MRRAVFICGVGAYQAGDPAPAGYLEWHEWARVQVRAGLRQEWCVVHERYHFPQEIGRGCQRRPQSVRR